MEQKETIFADVYVITSKGIKRKMYYGGITREELKHYICGISQGVHIASGYVGHVIAVINNNLNDTTRTNMSYNYLNIFYKHCWDNNLYDKENQIEVINKKK